MNEPDLSHTLAWLRSNVAIAANLTSDSRQVEPGDVFVAYPGARFDGREFIGEAIARGAAAVLWDPTGAYAWPQGLSVAHLPILGLKHLAGSIAAFWYHQPSQKMWSIGVTGTSGKSSIALWLTQAFTALERRAAFVGTLGIGFLGELRETGLTSPDPIALQYQLARLYLRGAQTVAMEVSSIGLVEGRIEGMKFDLAVFTNLTRDHLDYHKTMTEYEAAKATLFRHRGLRCAIVNFDDVAGENMARVALSHGAAVITTSANGRRDADLRAHATVYDADSMRFTIEGEFGTRSFVTPLIGTYNVSNLLAVLGVLLASDGSVDQALATMAGLTPAPGRLERVRAERGPLVLVDYAHKPDALEKALSACRPLAQARGGRLVIVFGCGGDRDPGKRPLMGQVALRLADSIVVTSDNPRSENPEAIIEAIVAGITAVPGNLNRPVVREANRALAIERTIREADARDVIVIAGKGHETYQEIEGRKQPFSDVEQASLALKNFSGVATC